MEGAGSAAMLSTLGTIFTQFLDWMGDIATTIAGNQLMLLPFGIFVVGASIGLIKRLLP